jgi:hypothetical protein
MLQRFEHPGTGLQLFAGIRPKKPRIGYIVRVSARFLLPLVLFGNQNKCHRNDSAEDARFS